MRKVHSCGIYGNYHKHPMNPSSSSLLRCVLLAVLFAVTSTTEAQLFKKKTTPELPLTQVPAVAETNPYLNPVSSQPLNQTIPLSLPATTIYQQSSYRPAYALPYEGYRYDRKDGRPRYGLFGSNKPSEEMLQLLDVIRERAETISRFGLPYVFGGDHPNEGGLDCSGAMKFLLSDIGFTDMPRTSYDQYAWLRKARTLRHTKTIPDQMGGRKGIKPGDLIFWGGTYDSGHKVSHVMIYLGQGRDGTHYMFGARGTKKTGLNGSGVDIFKLESGYQKSLVGFGSLPGVF